jgi:hypothetical protein
VKPRIPLPTNELNPLGLPDTSTLAPALAAARDQLRRAAFRMRQVDAVTTELVRIRNARHQSCYF